MDAEELSNEALNTRFHVGDWLADPSANELRRGDDTLRLEPKVMRVLCVLAEKPGAVVSREELESRVWTGLVVSYDALSNTIIKLRKAFGDDSREPRYIETISKSGYRLIAAVEAVQTGEPKPEGVEFESAAAAVSRKPFPARRMVLVGALLLVLLLALGGLWLASQEDRKPANSLDTETVVNRTRPGIAVLPFDNLSADPEQEYFSDGITEDLITDLSKLSGLLVVARNSAFAYKGSLEDEQAIGRELGVDYLLKGSVQRAGDRIRINVRLSDSRNGNNLWAERFDRKMGDIFAIQDELAAQIVSALEIEIAPEDRRRLTRDYVASVQAYDEFLRGLDHHGRRSFDDNTLSKVHYRKAIELDPGFARAYLGLALGYTREVLDGWDLTARESLDQAASLADKAERLDPSLPQIYFVKGQVELVRRNYAAAIRHAEHAISIQPNYADAHALLGWILHFAGRPRDGLASMERAMRLNPRAPSIYRMVRGVLHYSMGDADRALEDLVPAVDANPNFQQLRIWVAAAYAAAGRLEEAQWQSGEIQALYPGYSTSFVERGFPIRDPAYLDRFVDDLRNAGLP